MKTNKRRTRRGLPLILGGLLLIAAALSLTGYNLWDDARAERAKREILTELVPEIPEGILPPGPLQQVMVDVAEQSDATVSQPEVRYPYYMLDETMKMPVKTVNGFDYVATLQIPKLGLELPVMQEWNYERLQYSPCRYEGTPYLHNMVICAHNYQSHFGRNNSLKAGDAVILTDMDGNVFRYEVAEVETLEPTAVDEMTNGEWALTLFTCTVGGQYRVTVRCNELSSQ